MKRSFLLVIIICMVLFAIVLRLRWHISGNQASDSPVHLSVVPTPPATVPQSLLEFKEIAVDAKGIVQAEIFMNSGENRVTSVTLVIGYDPTVLQATDVETTDLFGGRTITKKEIDPQGKLLLSVMVDPRKEQAIQGADAVAKISFRVINRAAKTTQLTFLPETAIVAEGIPGSALTRPLSATISLTKNTPQEEGVSHE